MQKSSQLSESLLIGIILAFAGGFMDAYSYVCRDYVFANAQTGNIVLMGINFAMGKFSIALKYLFPVASFVSGIALADVIKYNRKEKNNIHWRQITILIQSIILCYVAFLPTSNNLLANSLTSFACGIQVESFRKIWGNSIATTMCIGNLRNATQLIIDFIHTKNKVFLEKGLLFYGIIICFALGAVLGNVCVNIFNEKAIIFSVAFLLTAFFIMFINPKNDTAIKCNLTK